MVIVPADLTNDPPGVSWPSATPSHVPWRRCSSAAVGGVVLQPACSPSRRHGRTRESTVKPSDSLRVIFFLWFPWLSVNGCAQETPNDQLTDGGPPVASNAAAAPGGP